MSRQLFQEVTKTYKTPENAQKALDEVLVNYQDRNFRYSISVVKSGTDYRFVPVIHLDRDFAYFAAALVNAGICVTG